MKHLPESPEGDVVSLLCAMFPSLTPDVVRTFVRSHAVSSGITTYDIDAAELCRSGRVTRLALVTTLALHGYEFIHCSADEKQERWVKQ
jgi:hypothetical protein